MTKPEERQGFTGFGLGRLSSSPPEAGVFILAVYADGQLTASAYATERTAMEAAAWSHEDDRGEDEESGTLEDLFVRAQRIISEGGGLMEIIPSPIHGS